MWDEVPRSISITEHDMATDTQGSGGDKLCSEICKLHFFLVSSRLLSNFILIFFLIQREEIKLSVQYTEGVKYVQQPWVPSSTSVSSPSSPLSFRITWQFHKLEDAWKMFRTEHVHQDPKVITAITQPFCMNLSKQNILCCLPREVGFWFCFGFGVFFVLLCFIFKHSANQLNGFWKLKIRK